MVDDTNPQRGSGKIPWLINQRRGHNVLYPSSSVTSSDSNQELQVVGGHGNDGGGTESQEREHGVACPVGVAATIGEEERLEVVAEGDGDDWEVGAESEDREQGEENVESEHEPWVCWWRLQIDKNYNWVDCVEIHQTIENSIECGNAEILFWFLLKWVWY